MKLPPQEYIEAAGSAQTTLEAERHRNHPRCLVCGDTNGRGFQLNFTVAADGSVSAVFQCEESLEGYAGIVHGGVVSCLLDGAMTNCLFARGIIAVTAELTVRFQRLLRVGEPARVRAWITRSSPHLHFLAAEITQSGSVAATARGKFRRLHDPPLQTQETS
jgi:acyl-coenzyme A thioesterase PaaI-like protein